MAGIEKILLFPTQMTCIDTKLGISDQTVTFWLIWKLIWSQFPSHLDRFSHSSYFRLDVILTPCLWRLMLKLTHFWNMCSFENPNWPEVPPPLSVLLLLWKSRKVQMLVIDYESYVPVSNEHSKQFSLSEKTIRQLKKGKQYFLGFPGFPLYYLLFAPLWDQLKPYSLKKPFMANYLFWQSSMAFSPFQFSSFYCLKFLFTKLKMALV